MKLIPRKYQMNIYHSILNKGNTLVVLPTGLGKTLIAIMLIKEKMKSGTCLFLAPTKPLVQQHFDSITKILEAESPEISMVTGSLDKNKRIKEYKKPILVATPQTIRNDLNDRLFPTDNLSLVVFDEAHRAIGDYAYTKIAKNLNEKTLILALTASPGGRASKIKDVMKVLSIKNVEIRTSKDEDVAPFVHKSQILWQFVDLPPKYKLIKHQLESLQSKHARTLAAFGFPPPLKSKTQFMKLRSRILGSKHRLKFVALIEYAILLNLMHMIELLETQSLHALYEYLKSLKTKQTKSAKRLQKSPTILNIIEKCEQDLEQHPKMKLLLNILKKESGKKAIVFAQYRSQVKYLSKTINENGLSANPFMGKKDGFTKKIQEKTINDFRDGAFQVLCCSSIGEEGLDIPAVDVVIFYEPIPSEIRSIQRRGRTGRFGKGTIYILITRKTRDEYFYWASLNREKKMKNILYSMSETGEIKIPRKKSPQKKLDDF